MKKDMRVSYPLWMMCFIVLIASTIYLVGTTAVVEGSGVDEITFSLSFESNLIAFYTLLILFVGSLSTFFIKMLKHNRENPQRKLLAFYLKPPEYIEDDELFQQATAQATKKVYTFFASAIPMLAILYIFPIGKMWMIIGLLLLGFAQYLIYYIAIRKYLIEA